MLQGSGRYLLITIASTGLLIFFWLGVDSPLNPEHISLNSQDEVLALEDTLIAHYADKLDPDYQAPRNFFQAANQVRVLLQTYQQRLDIQRRGLVNDDDDVLKVIASVSAPVVAGQKLQATAVKIIPSDNPSNKETFIYIGYNMIGPKHLGAVQILSLKEVEPQKKRGKKKKQKAPLEVRLLQTALLKDSEVHDLTLLRTSKKSFLLIAGQTSGEEFTTPAFMEVLPLKNNIINDELETSRIDLPSFAATSILVAHNHVFVSVGDVGGGILQIERVESLKEGTHSYQKLEQQFFALEDARDLAANNHSVYAISGGQATLWSKRYNGQGNSGPAAQTTYLEGGLIPEAKSTIDVTQSFAYIGLGDGGTQIISLNQRAKAGEIPQYSDEQLESAVTVTNSVSISGRELFTADGEAGSRLFQMTGPMTLEEVAHIRFGPKTSVNEVQKIGDYVVFAVGLGGVKIAKHFK